MNKNLGGIATGFWNAKGEFLMSWTAVLSQGPQAGRAATFTLGGHASVVLVPAATYYSAFLFPVFYYFQFEEKYVIE